MHFKEQIFVEEKQRILEKIMLTNDHVKNILCASKKVDRAGNEARGRLFCVLGGDHGKFY